jgi:hypothetical protein
MKMTITQVAYPKPGRDEEGHRFNEEKVRGESVEELLEWLKNHYGLTPPRRPRGVFIDTKDGGSVQTGIIICRWAGGEVRNEKKYWEENWVSFMSDPQPVPLPKKLQVTA